MTILVIEDDPASSVLISEVVRSFTDQVISKENGLEGMNYFLEHNEQIQLVIADILLPRMDGMSVIRQIRKRNPWLPIIGISASTQVNRNNECFAAGCNHFFQKPIQIDQFADSINQILQKSNQPI